MTFQKTFAVIPALFLAVGLAFLAAGCGNGADEEENGDSFPPSSGAPGENAADSADASGENAAGSSAGNYDSVPFVLLQWKFGGINGSHAAVSTPSLANLKCNRNTLSYKWVVGLEGWGLAKNDAGALCAAFVEKEDGSWVGGKFDWVSTSHTAKGLENVLAGYDGWNLAGVPNPCMICFVVIDANGKRRSNVIGPAIWQR